jgi:hypothetical protein
MRQLMVSEPDWCGPEPTHGELRKEIHRLRESKMLLVLMAEELGIAAPRSCCPHPGAGPCVMCSSDWLVGQLCLPPKKAPAIRI